MKKILFNFLLLFVLITYSSAADDPCLPQQVHLSLGNEYHMVMEGTDTTYTNNSIWIVFETLSECKDARIILTKEQQQVDLTKESNDMYSWNYTNTTDNTTVNYTRWIHVHASGSLEKHTNYTYHCYGDTGTTLLTGPFTFKLPGYDKDDPTEKPPKLIFFGDFDALIQGEETYQSLLLEAQTQDPDFSEKVIFHMGDIAYDLEDDVGMRGDIYFNKMQPIIAQIPYMYTYGNHENYKTVKGANYSNAQMRFRMPQWRDTRIHRYSINFKNVHFFSVNYQMYYDQPELRPEIEEWLENDLKLANNDINRQERPWLINFSHFPFYCSEPEQPTCDSYNDSFSKLDDIIHKYNVDFFISGHVHMFEQTYPVYKNYSGYDVLNYTTQLGGDIYKNPKGTVFVAEGLPGNDRSEDKDYTPDPYWSKKVSNIKGYGVLSILNETTILYERKSTETGEIIDNFMIQKDQLRTFDTSKKSDQWGTILLVTIGVLVLAAIILSVYACQKVKERANTSIQNGNYENAQTNV